MICRDWNLVLDPSVDYINVNNPRARDVDTDFMKRYDFCDLHMRSKEYTWKRFNPVRKFARLDFFLVNKIKKIL